MIQEIVKLRESGYTFQQIADQLNTTVGKVHYRWTKYKKSLIQLNNENANDTARNTIVENSAIEQDLMDDTFWLMVRNAQQLYAYWEVTEKTKHIFELQFSCKWGTVPKVLKIYDVSSIIFNGNNAHRSFEIKLSKDERYCFISNLEPNRTYIAELGIHSFEQFFTIVRSNPVDTPRTSPHQAGTLTKDVLDWKSGICEKPSWLENFSTYSYYENIK